MTDAPDIHFAVDVIGPRQHDELVATDSDVSSLTSVDGGLPSGVEEDSGSASDTGIVWAKGTHDAWPCLATNQPTNHCPFQAPPPPAKGASGQRLFGGVGGSWRPELRGHPRWFWNSVLFRGLPGPLGLLALESCGGVSRKGMEGNHLEERLLDQAQATASYTPPFWGHSRSIP